MRWASKLHTCGGSPHTWGRGPGMQCFGTDRPGTEMIIGVHEQQGSICLTRMHFHDIERSIHLFSAPFLTV